MNSSSGEEKLTYSGIFKSLTILVICVLIVHAAAWYLFLSFRQPKSTFDKIRQQKHGKPNAVLLESLFSQLLPRLRKEEETILGSYGWVDRENDIVRIPIEQAMNLVVESKELDKPAQTETIEQP